MSYIIMPKELQVMLQLLAKAAREQTLTAQQLEMLGWDETDLTNDLLGQDIKSVKVELG